MKNIFNNSSIQAISSCIPSQIVYLKDQADLLYNGDLKKVQRIQKSIGLNARHLADQNTTTLDLCFEACQQIFTHSPILPSQIDALIFVTQTPNFLQPNNAHLLHGKLHLSHQCACFDLNQGCSGYIYGLFLASILIQNGSKHILLCAGDTLSKVVDPTDSNTSPIFGDAGSATLVSFSDNTSYFSLHADGKGWENIILPNSGFCSSQCFTKTPFDSHYLCMDGAEVFNFSIDKEPSAILEILEYSQTQIEDIDHIFFHQANAYIISNIARRLNLPLEKAPIESIGKYGNTSSASIPLAICDLLHSTSRSKNLEVILSGFGVGLSWATCLTTLANNAMILKPKLYQGEK